MDNKVACKYCGEMIDPDTGFCPVCGAVNKRAFRQDPDKEYCKFCGAELSGNEEFCLVCGTPVRRVLAGGSSAKRTSIDDIVPDLKKKDPETLVQNNENSEQIKNDSTVSSGSARGEAQGDEPLNFLQKAALKQQQDAVQEEELEKRRIEEVRAFNEEKNKLKASATQVYKSNAAAPGSTTQSTKRYEGGPAVTEEGAALEKLKKEAAEAGVSVEEMKLFEQVKANFESENETYPDDYNVNDYAQFDYAQSRYGSFNLGSLELESMEYQNQEAQEEEPEPKPVAEPRKETVEKGVIGVKKKKTPLALRILFFFVAIFAVVGLAGIILYVVPMVKQVHPEEILLEESVDTAEMTITPISAATSTPTPTLSPTPTMTPTPTVNAIIPQSITPTVPVTDTPTPTPTEVPEEEEPEEEPEEEEPEEVEVEIPEEVVEETPEEVVEEPQPTEPPAVEVEATQSGYLVSDSDSRVMDASELDGKSPEEVRLIANEIYARYGYTFQNEAYASYFSQFDWYNPVYPAGEFPEDIMSEAAHANLNMITEYEAQHGY